MVPFITSLPKASQRLYFSSKKYQGSSQESAIKQVCHLRSSGFDGRYVDFFIGLVLVGPKAQLGATSQGLQGTNEGAEFGT